MLSIEGDTISVLTDAQDVLVESVLQELRLWKGEKQTDIEAGVDYKAVINKEAFLKTEVEKVLNKYRDKFKDIIIGDVIEEEGGEVVRLPITFYLSNDDVVVKDLRVG